MIEINWGKPLTLIVAENGDTRKITTIEQAKFALRKYWPVADKACERALSKIEGAMECMLPIQAARSAFVDAAHSAGFKVQHPAKGHEPDLHRPS
ncbi:DUF982 domain-containing protein [Paracoccus sp. (in: a-proteobacteria)]|uniref:DUF982 domain-containing protein n=1 Tax=Paracoccus sp. TaxID=267 RepID=UPI00289BC26E|nr:DUF982 domain-containing protein [Paracoccus sp. (in: a-proteobacteria)]